MLDNKINRKGNVLDNFTMMLIIFGILVLVVLVFFIFSLASPIIADSSTEVLTQIDTALNSSNTNSESQNASSVSIANLPAGVSNLKWFSYVIFFAMAFGFFIVAVNVRTNGYFAVFWVLLVLLLVVVSMILSNSYESLATDSYLGGLYSDSPTNDFLMRNLPIVTLILGIVGGILLFVVGATGSVEEGSIL